MRRCFLWMQNYRRLLFVLAAIPSSGIAWQQCSEDAGGGVCPNRATCCPTGVAGVSGCISGRARDPPDVQGQCCSTSTGCSYGYSCDMDDSVMFSIDRNVTQSMPICRRNDPHPDYLNAPKTKRYELCRLSPDVAFYVQKLRGFPVTLTDDARLERTDRYNLGYYSSLGSITEQQPTKDNRFASIETVLIIIHGSGRTADDYLCAGMSVIPDSVHNFNNDINDNYNKYLVIAPLFAADTDTEERSLVDNLLYWADKGERVPLGHTWRYGADAMNHNISSYGALDSMVEYIISSTSQFPNLKQVVMAGHSAGGQVVHRWGLLSSNAVIWEQQHVEMRVVVANPRSYCYLDDRRVLFGNRTNNTNHDVFAIPSHEDVESCPSYSQWQWGLRPGGDVVCHYKERILKAINATDLANRYGSRKVFYLTGELDVIEQMDRCEAKKFQGFNRNHRARNYFMALNEYFGGSLKHCHRFRVIPGSPHDHFLMFQSESGRRSLFGSKGAEKGGHMDDRVDQTLSEEPPKVSYWTTLKRKSADFFAWCRRNMLRSSLWELRKGRLCFRKKAIRMQD